MTRKELDALKDNIAQRKEKSSDLDIIVSQIMRLPYGQVKKVLTDEVRQFWQSTDTRNKLTI